MGKVKALKPKMNQIANYDSLANKSVACTPVLLIGQSELFGRLCALGPAPILPLVALSNPASWAGFLVPVSVAPRVCSLPITLHHLGSPFPCD